MPHVPPPTCAMEALTEADRVLIQAALSDPLLIPLTTTFYETAT